jgi:heme exporter protein B
MPIPFFAFHKTKAIFLKELTCEFRCHYGSGSLLMFSLTTLAAVSMSIGSQSLEPEFLSVLFWIILFFSSMAGLSRVFLQENDAGTLQTLRIYAGSQPVFFGKFLYNLLLLFALTTFLLPLFVIFLNVSLPHFFSLCLILLLGDVGLAASTTLIASLITQAQGQSSLFTVLNFPIILPLLLFCIQLTTAAFSPEDFVIGSQMLFLAVYDVIILALASVLFDYIWYD